MVLKIFKLLDYLLYLFFSPNQRGMVKNVPKKIAVIKLSAMGDAIALMPSIRCLKNAFPTSHLTWITTSRTNPNFFMPLNFFNDTINLGLNFKFLNFISKIIHKKKLYDLIIDYDQYYMFSEYLTFTGTNSAGLINKVKGNSFGIKINYDAYINEKFQFLSLTNEVLKNYNKPQITHDEYKISLPELCKAVTNKKFIDYLQNIKKNKKKLVFVYPGSSENAKFRRWPIEYYVTLVNKLSSLSNIIIAGGKDEVQLAKYFKNNKKIKIFINEFSLSEWSWIFLNHGDLLVGNDGGLLHVAEAQNIPIIGIFGPALYAKWGSINNKSKACEINLSCRPCLRNYERKVPQKCWRGDLACLNGISVNEVYQKVKISLSELK